jgi:hypothetical protein
MFVFAFGVFVVLMFNTCYRDGICATAPNTRI